MLKRDPNGNWRRSSCEPRSCRGEGLPFALSQEGTVFRGTQSLLLVSGKSAEPRVAPAGEPTYPERPVSGEMRDCGGVELAEYPRGWRSGDNRLRESVPGDQGPEGQAARSAVGRAMLVPCAQGRGDGTFRACDARVRRAGLRETMTRGGSFARGRGVGIVISRHFAIVAAALALTGSVAGAAPARAESSAPEHRTPVVLMPARTRPGQVLALRRPRRFSIWVAGPSAWVVPVHWSRWTAGYARGAGPGYGADVHVFRLGHLTLHLSDPVTGHGYRYFGRLRIAGGHGIARYWHWVWAGPAPGWLPVGAPTARSSRLPVLYSGMGGRWANPAVQPRTFVLGAYYYMAKMAWSRWTDHSAAGRGKQVACAGASGPCDNYRVTITLTRVRRHQSRSYYSLMQVAGRGHKTYWLVMRDGFWQHR